ncbi:DNA/RNA non-specific endonuclease [Prevotella sp. HCN-7019]|uniref:DNA/RNA non-specific endonuclease n=1 Tax=Prevotella sp. HCN-7019 TaxID=3134668 RepID=UPI0030C4082F
MRTRTFYAGLALAALTMTASCSDAMRHRAATLKAIAGAVANDSQVSREQPEGGDDLLLSVTPDSVPSMILERAGYVTSYNKKTKLPNWVAWHLTADNTKGSHSRKGIDFMEDEDVPTPRADDWDYYNSGYDRGHMCPAGDNKWDSEAMRQSFLFTNICPQAPGLNRGDWNEMENACRSWARENGDIYIVCGPILYKGRHKTIGKHKVVVPEAFFKVVLCMRGTPKAIGFIYKNEDGNRPKGDYVNSVDEVERITGFDFFQSLPDDVEQAVEATADLNEWQ